MANTSYNRIIRKLVIGFGNLFKNITLVRYNPDLSEAERMIVPIVYATKELYVRRLEDDPDLNKKIQIALPRMSFEMAGLTYDSSRKQNTNFKQFAKTEDGVISQYNPVPYNFDFNLYIYVRNVEDGTQIIEHILPYFTPDYTIKLNLIPEMGIVREIPIILNNTSSDIIYEGDKNSETRMIIWTLNFTVKGFIFGKTTEVGLIRNSITNILSTIHTSDVVSFNMGEEGVGVYQVGETVYQGYSPTQSTATGRVTAWNDSILHLTEINGNFMSDLPIIGTKTLSNYSFVSYQLAPKNLAQIVIVPKPSDANGNTLYTTVTVINEIPNINTAVITTDAGFAGDLGANVFGIDDLETELENITDLQ
jgi:hypothetical protein